MATLLLLNHENAKERKRERKIICLAIHRAILGDLQCDEQPYPLFVLSFFRVFVMLLASLLSILISPDNLFDDQGRALRSILRSRDCRSSFRQPTG
jgi:hypothetical protein